MHLTPQQISLLIKRRLGPRELLEVTRHLADCEGCRSLLHAQPSERIRGLKSRLDAELMQHLSYEELAGYVDGSVQSDSLDAIANHLDECSECATEVEELQTLHGSLLSKPSKNDHEKDSNRRTRVVASAAPRARSVTRYRVALLAIPLLLVAGAIVAWNYTKLPIAKPESISATTPAPAGDRPPLLAASPAALANHAIAASLKDGLSTIVIDEAGRVSGIEGLSDEEMEMLKQALSMRKVPRPQLLNQLKSKSSKLMGTAGQTDAFSLVAPLGTAVESDRPTLRWQGVESASAYVVTILDTDFNILQTSEPLRTTSWTPTRALSRDAVYLWQVMAETKDGRRLTAPATPAPEARFSVMSRARSEQLKRSLDTHGQSHLMKGLLFANAGALDESEREFRALARQNPDSQVATALLNNLKAIRR